MSPTTAPDLRGGRPLLGFLILVCVATAGCTAVLPAKTPPSDVAVPSPQLVCDATWNGDSVTITVTDGPRIDPDPGEAVRIHPEFEEERHWVAGDSGLDAVQSAPLDPGDVVTVGVSEDTDRVDVVWSGAEDRTAQLCETERPAGGTAGA